MVKPVEAGITVSRLDSKIPINRYFTGQMLTVSSVKIREDQRLIADDIIYLIYEIAFP